MADKQMFTAREKGGITKMAGGTTFKRHAGLPANDGPFEKTYSTEKFVSGIDVTGVRRTFERCQWSISTVWR